MYLIYKYLFQVNKNHHITYIYTYLYILYIHLYYFKLYYICCIHSNKILFNIFYNYLKNCILNNLQYLIIFSYIFFNFHPIKNLFHIFYNYLYINYILHIINLYLIFINIFHSYCNLDHYIYNKYFNQNQINHNFDIFIFLSILIIYFHVLSLNCFYIDCNLQLMN